MKRYTNQAIGSPGSKTLKVYLEQFFTEWKKRDVSIGQRRNRKIGRLKPEDWKTEPIRSRIWKKKDQFKRFGFGLEWTAIVASEWNRRGGNTNRSYSGMFLYSYHREYSGPVDNSPHWLLKCAKLYEETTNTTYFYVEISKEWLTADSDCGHALIASCRWLSTLSS